MRDESSLEPRQLPPDPAEEALLTEVSARRYIRTGLDHPMWWCVIAVPSWYAYKYWGSHWQTALVASAGFALYAWWLVTTLLGDSPAPKPITPEQRAEQRQISVAIVAIIVVCSLLWNVLTR